MSLFLQSFTFLNYILIIVLCDNLNEKATTAAFKEAEKGRKADRTKIHFLIHVADYWMAITCALSFGSFVDLLKHPVLNHLFLYVCTLIGLAFMIMLTAYLTRLWYRFSNGRENAFLAICDQDKQK